MLDMSKAFDTIDRKTLIEDLSNFVDKDELHLFSILLKDIKIAIKIENETGNFFTTNIGTPQGDCLSAVLFTLYLAKALKTENTSDHNYTNREKQPEPNHLADHNYNKAREQYTVIDQQYADDIGWIATGRSEHVLNEIQSKTTEKLKERNLKVNQEKTELYNVKRKGDESWKKCKYLGSLLDTEEDIKRRTQLANQTYYNLQKTLKSNKLSKKTKIKLFQTFIQSIFLYNSELWSTTKKLENKVDALQRTLLRRTLKIHWPETITNKKLYEVTQLKPWSTEIKIRRLRWFGHLCRLPCEAPAKKALQESLRPTKRPQGRPKTTWLSILKKDLKEININNIQEGIDKAKDRDVWKSVVGSIKSQ